MQRPDTRPVLVGVGVVVAALLVLTIPLLGGDADTRRVQFVDDGQVIETLTVEVADTPAEREVGLMNRSTLPDGYGMLFLFEQPEQRTFWMKDTHVPLDIIFLDAEKQVLNVEQADPQPNASETGLARYHSNGSAQYVIETRQGFAEEHGIGPGTQVVWNRDS